MDDYKLKQMNQGAARYWATLGGEPTGPGDDMYNDRVDNVKIKDDYVTEIGKDEAGNPIMGNPLNVISDKVEIPKAEQQSVFDNLKDYADTLGGNKIETGLLSNLTDMAGFLAKSTAGRLNNDPFLNLFKFATATPEQQKEMALPNVAKRNIDTTVRRNIRGDTATEILHAKLYEDFVYGPESAQHYAEVKRLSNITGIKEELFARDPERYKNVALLADRITRMKMLKKYQDADGNVNMQKIYNDIPGLRKVQEEKGTSAASLALENVEGLQTVGDVYKNSSIGQFYGNVSAGFQKEIQTIRKIYNWAGPTYGARMPNAEEQKALADVDATMKTIPKYSYQTGLGTAGAMLGGFAENLHFMAPEVLIRGGIGLATKGSTKGQKAADVLAVGTMAAMTAPLQYEELINRTDENGNPVYTPAQARNIAIAQAIPQAILEDYSLRQIGNAIFGRNAAKSLQDIVTKSAGVEAMKAGVRDFIKYKVGGALKSGAIGYGAEFAEEFEQAISDRLVENIAQIMINGKEADVESIDNILADATGEAVAAWNAIGGFGLAGLLLHPVANTRAVLNFRNSIRMATTNRMVQGAAENAHYTSVLSGVWENKGNIKELHDKAPDVEATILDEHNREAGIENGFVDVKTLSEQEGGKEIVQEIAKRNNYSDEELAKCLDGSGMLFVKTSTLMQMDVKENQQSTIMQNVTTSMDNFTEAQRSKFYDTVKTIMDGFKEYNENTTKQAIENIISARFPNAEQAKLARDIIETNYDNPQAEYSRRLSSINEELKTDIDPIIEELKTQKAKPGRGRTFVDMAVDVLQGKETGFKISELDDVTRKRVDNLIEQRNALLGIREQMRNLNASEMIATATLSAEGLKVYDTLVKMMDASENKNVRAAGRANALLTARMADRIAKAYSDARRVPYTAEDYMREFFRLDVNAVYNENQQQAAQLLQPMLPENKPYISDENGNIDIGYSSKEIEMLAQTPNGEVEVVFKSIPIRLQVGYQVGKTKGGAGYVHIIRRHSDLLKARGYELEDGSIDVYKAIKDILAKPSYVIPSMDNETERKGDRFRIVKEVPGHSGMALLLEETTDDTTGQNFYTIISILPIPERQSKKEKSKASSFSGERSPQKQLPAAVVFDTPAGIIAGSPGGSDAHTNDGTLPIISLTDAKEYVNKFTYEGDELSQTTNNTLMQEAMPERDLVAYHNMSEDGLLKSAALGGLPVPSIAVTKKDTPFNQFGQITLIGGSDIVDPARSGNDVYSQDAWTVTFPETVYDKVKVKDIRAFADDVKDAFNALGGDSRTQLSEFVYKLQNDHRRRYMQTDLYNSLAMKYKYVKDVLGETVKIPTKKVQVNEEYILKNKKIREAILDFGPQPSEEQKKKLAKLLLPVLKEYAKTIPVQKSNTITIDGETYTDRGPSFDGRQIVNSKGEKQSKEIVYAISNLLHYNDVEKTLEHLREVAQKTTPVFPKLAQKAIEFIENAKIETDDLQNQFVSAFFDKDGSVNERIYYNLLLNARLYGKTEVDERKLRESLEKKIAKNEKGYNDYINQQLDRLYRNPKIMVGNKKADITLDNIVEAMMKKRGAGKEDSLVFNNHKALASMAKKFKSLDEIRKNKNRLTDSEKAELSYKVYEEAGDKYREAVGPYYKYGITFDTYDDANKAVVDAAKAGGSESAIRNALRRNNFKDVPANVVEAMKAVLDAAKDVQTDYFEAKPLRAVGFNEFSAAVVPKGTSKEAIEFLKSQGVAVTKYDPDVPGDRQAKTQKAAEKANVYFQQGRTAKGAISVNERNERLIQLFTEGADQSTFIHEMAHMFLMDLQTIAGIDPNSQQAKDLKTILAWAEYKPGQAEDYKGTASYEEFRKRDVAIKEAEAKGDTTEAQRLKDVWAQERFARAFEEYLRNGEAPAKGLKKSFRQFKKWLTEIYKDVTGAGVRASVEVEAVMARMIASEEEIEALEAQNSIARKIVDAVPETAAEVLKNMQEEAKEHAKEKLLKELMQAFEQNNMQDLKMKLDEVRKTTEEELQKVPCFICEKLISNGMSVESAIRVAGFSTEQEYKDALKSAGGSLKKAVSNAVKAAKESIVLQMPDRQQLYNMAEDALNSGDYNYRLSELEADILKAMQEEYNSLPAKLRRAFEEIDKGFDSEFSKETWEAFKKSITSLKYAERWGAREFALIKDFEDAVNKLEEPDREAVEKLRKRYEELKEQTIRNKEWITGIADATKGKVKAIKTAAEVRLAEETVSAATNPRYWHRKALEAAKRAWDGLKKVKEGEKADYNNAVMAKQEQALFDAMTAQAIENKKKVDKMVNGRTGFLARGKRMADPKVKADPNLRYYYNHLLYIYGLRNSDAIPPTDLKDIEKLFVGLQASYQLDESIPLWLMSAAKEKEPKKNYQQLTMGELAQLKKFTDMLYTLAKNQNGLLTMDVDMGTVQADCTVDFANNIDYEVGGQRINEIKGAIGSYMTSLLKPERFLALLGGEHGSHIRYVYQTLFKAAENEEKMQEQEAQILRDLYGKYFTKQELRAILNDNIPGLSIGADTEITKENLICMALNWGNETNRARLIVGLFPQDFNDNLTKAQKERNLAIRQAQLMDILQVNLTEKDWQFVQAMLDHIDSFANPVSRVLEKSIGIPLNRVKAQAFDVQLSDGKILKMNGGYYPIVKDSSKSTRVSEFEQMEEARAIGGISVFGTGMGTTKDRADNLFVNQGPLRLTLDVAHRHIDTQIHLITMRMAVRDAYKVLNSDAVKAQIEGTFGQDTMNSLNEWVLNCWAPPIKPMNRVQQIAGNLRSGSIGAIMAYRVSTALLNFANIVYMANEIGPINAVKAVVDFYKHPFENREAILAASVYMRNRATNMDRDLNAQNERILNRHEGVLGKVGNAVDKATGGMSEEVRYQIDKYSNWLIEQTDMCLSLPLYHWQFVETYNAELAKGVSEEEAREKANFEATRRVTKVFPSSRKIDSSEVQRDRDEFTKLLTPFFSFANTLMNAVWSKYYEGKYNGRVELRDANGNVVLNENGDPVYTSVKKQFISRWGRFVLAALMDYVVGALFETWLRQIPDALAGGGGDDDDDRIGWWVFSVNKKKTATNILDSLSAGFYGINALIDAERVYKAFVEGKGTYGSGRGVGVLSGTAQRGIKAFMDVGQMLNGSDKIDMVDFVRDMVKASNAKTGFSDTLTDAFFNTIRFAESDGYSLDNMADLREYIAKTIFDRKLKKK